MPQPERLIAPAGRMAPNLSDPQKPDFQTPKSYETCCREVEPCNGSSSGIASWLWSQYQSLRPIFLLITLNGSSADLNIQKVTGWLLF